jgi:hypothetical protein
MTSAESSDQILKTDSLARVRTSRERRRELLEEFERSGLSGSQFASLVGVKYSTFAAWVAKRKRSPAAKIEPGKVADGRSRVRWLEAVVDQAQGAAGKESCVLTVHFGGGARVDIGSLQQAMLAAALLRALEKPWPGC